ncbi:MAG: hypothetical protein ABR543_11950 [Gemmatimonadaceae bacterium]
MQRLQSNLLVQGAIGGILAGAVVAVWFLILDIATAEALRTPLVMARAVLHDESTVATFRLVAVYTILHFGVFVLLGIGTAWFLVVANIAPGVLVGAVFGLGVLDSVHYGALLVTGANMLTLLPVWHVLGANLLGGIVLMTYLHRVLHTEAPMGTGVLREHELLLTGLTTGLIGAGAVAIWFLVLDVIRGSPFFTPAALGSVVFFGATSPSEVEVGLGVIAAYTILHLAAFAAVGLALAWGAEKVERTPNLWLMWLLAFIILEGLFLGVVGSLGGWVLGSTNWWAVGIGNLIAMAAMGRWIWRSHPVLRDRMRDMPIAA